MADAVAEAIKDVHPNAILKVAKDAQYLSGGLQSYSIVQDPYSGHWRIKGYKQSPNALNRQISGTFTTFKQANDSLIAYLRTTDRVGGRKAVWPGR
jgi:hypothetical protein